MRLEPMQRVQRSIGLVMWGAPDRGKDRNGRKELEPHWLSPFGMVALAAPDADFQTEPRPWSSKQVAQGRTSGYSGPVVANESEARAKTELLPLPISAG